MKILALEFSSAHRGVAVIGAGPDNGPALAGQTVLIDDDRASGMAQVSDTLRKCGVAREEIDAIAVGLGPGSYTGIRAAIAMAQGWQLARSIPSIGLASTDCLAAQIHAAGGRGRLRLAIDAQRLEYYLAGYLLDESGPSLATPLRLASAADVTADLTEGERLLGPDLARRFPGAADAYPDAAWLGRLAWSRRCFTPADRLEPIYLRPASFVKAPPPRSIRL